MVLASIWHLGPDVWTAIATWVAAVVAVVAAFIGLRQLAEARTIRREESQPYVIALIDESVKGEPYFDLVIRNTGRTPARKVAVTFDQPLESAVLAGRLPITTPDEIPLLVPDQEWRTFWDWSGKRASESKFPMRYTATVRFQDMQKRDYGPYEFVLDWDVLAKRNAITVKTLHDGMSALEKIAEHFKS